MKAVILTAGEGIRIRPLTNTMTKGMIPIANKPILEHILDALKGVGITDIVMVVGYKKEKILTYFGDGSDFDVDITFVEQRKQLGTAHALRQAEHLLDEDFIVLPGDNYIESGTLEGMVGGDEPYQVIVTESNIPSKYGIVTLRRGNIEDIKVVPRVSEDPSSFGLQKILTHSMWKREMGDMSRLIFTCICHFDPEVFRHMDEMEGKAKNNITGLIKHMMDSGIGIRGIRTDIWQDAVYPWDLLFLNNLALARSGGRRDGEVEKGVFLNGPVVIGRGTTIRSNSYILGPVVIGEGCDIGPNACIYPSTSIGNNVSVDAFVKITNSMIMDDVSVASAGLIRDSVLAAGVKCGPNVSTETVDIEGGIEGKMEHISSIGCVVGEDTNIGHGTVLNGGVVVGSRCVIDALVQVRNNISDDCRVVR